MANEELNPRGRGKHPRSIEKIVNQLPAFERKEVEYLQELADHVEALRTRLDRAIERTKKRKDPETGFTRGCRCRSCMGRVRKLEDKLLNAQIKLQEEKHRIIGKNYDDHEEQRIAEIILNREFPREEQDA